MRRRPPQQCREHARFPTAIPEPHAVGGWLTERLEPARLYRWRERLGVSTGHQLAASAAGMPERAAFVEVQSHRPSRIELVLRSGHVLFVPDSFDPSALSRLVEILERATEC